MGYATYETRELAKRARAELSTPELLLWDELRAKRLDGLKFRRKHPMFTFVLDFYCPALKLCVQLGDVHAGDPLLERKLHFIRVHIVRVTDPRVLLTDAGLAGVLNEIRTVARTRSAPVAPIGASDTIAPCAASPPSLRSP